MDLDAIILFSRVLNQEKVEEADFLVMSSAINNGTIDINSSIYENILKVNTFDIQSINSLIGDIKDIINIPLYKLLIKRPDLWNLLKCSFAKKYLKDESLLAILEDSLSIIEDISYEEQVNLYMFLIDLLSRKKIENNQIFQNSQIISTFILNNDSYIIELSKRNDSKISFYKRIFILKLFTYGLASFDYPSIATNCDKTLTGYYNIISPLVKSRNFGHLRLVFNTRVINQSNIDIVILVIEDSFKELYSVPQSEEDKEKDLKIIKLVNNVFDLLFDEKDISNDFINQSSVRLEKK